jgi:hypothetical protein
VDDLLFEGADMNRSTCVVLVFGVGIGLALGALSVGHLRESYAVARDDSPQRDAKADVEDPNPAVNDTDRFAWGVFVKINSAAKNGTNDAIWETWATDRDTFPAEPDLKKPPIWPGNAPRKKLLQRSTQQLLRQKLLEASPQQQLLRELGRGAPNLPRIVAGGEQEVRRNKPDFDFIVKNNLWYREGVEAAFKKGEPISFPVPAIEIKAEWKPINDAEKPNYHWNIDSNNKLFGLIALHIMTKDVPNWVWATWEHVDNPDRCKILECHDSFGVLPNGKVSPALKALFKQAWRPSGRTTVWTALKSTLLIRPADRHCSATP